MTKTRLRLAALAVLAFSLLATSCLQMRVVSLVGDKALGSGDTTSYKIDLFRMSDNNDSNSYVFVMVGLDGLDFVSFSNFDLKGNFGGPMAPTGHAALLTLARTGSECEADGVSASEIDAAGYDEWYIRRTTTRIDSASHGFSEKFRLKLNVARESGTDDYEEGDIVIFSGNWSDLDDDGIAESGEVTCTAFYGGSIPFKP